MTETITPLTKRFAYVSLGVPDVDAAVDWFRTIGHLSVSERGTDCVYLTGSTDHHWLRLQRSDRPGVYRLGYEMVDADALDVLAQRLDARGIPYTSFGDVATDRIADGLRFTDPDGVDFDCFVQMVELPFAPAHSIANLTDLLHAVWLVSDTEEGLAFYQDVLGFRPSDWIERRMVFMRSANNYHHSAGCGGAGPMGGKLDHIAFLVDSLDDVMRIRNYGMAHGATIRQDLCRHAASGSMGVYFVEPQTGIGVEFCTGHGVIDDPDHRARIMPASPVTADVWLEGPPADVLIPTMPLAVGPAPVQAALDPGSDA